MESSRLHYNGHEVERVKNRQIFVRIGGVRNLYIAFKE